MLSLFEEMKSSRSKRRTYFVFVMAANISYKVLMRITSIIRGFIFVVS